MKKQLFLIVWLIVISIQSNAQVTTTSNVPAAGTDYVGWNNTATIPLRIKNDANYDMEFYTNSTQRMTLKNTGELGIGTTAPSSWLHVLSRTGGAVAATEVFRTAVPTATETNWRMQKGTTTVMRLWVPGNSDAVFMQNPRGDFKIL